MVGRVRRIGRYSLDYRSMHRSSIDRYSYRSIYLVVPRDFTDTSPIQDRYCTDASPILYLRRVSWLISVDISVDALVGTRPPLDRSINALVPVDGICRYICRYVGRQYLVSVDISVDSIWYRLIYRRIVSSIGR